MVTESGGSGRRGCFERSGCYSVIILTHPATLLLTGNMPIVRVAKVRLSLIDII